MYRGEKEVYKEDIQKGMDEPFDSDDDEGEEIELEQLVQGMDEPFTDDEEEEEEVIQKDYVEKSFDRAYAKIRKVPFQGLLRIANLTKSDWRNIKRGAINMFRGSMRLNLNTDEDMMFQVKRWVFSVVMKNEKSKIILPSSISNAPTRFNLIFDENFSRVVANLGLSVSARNEKFIRTEVRFRNRYDRQPMVTSDGIISDIYILVKNLYFTGVRGHPYFNEKIYYEIFTKVKRRVMAKKYSAKDLKGFPSDYLNANFSDLSKDDWEIIMKRSIISGTDIDHHTHGKSSVIRRNMMMNVLKNARQLLKKKQVFMDTTSQGKYGNSLQHEIQQLERIGDHIERKIQKLRGRSESMY